MKKLLPIALVAFCCLSAEAGTLMNTCTNWLQYKIGPGPNGSWPGNTPAGGTWFWLEPGGTANPDQQYYDYNGQHWDSYTINYYAPGGATAQFNYTNSVGGSPPLCASSAPTTNCSTLIVKNVDPIVRWFLVYTNGNAWKIDSINPGAVARWEYCVTNGGLVIVTADRFALGGSDASDGHFQGQANTNGAPSPTGTQVGGDPSGGVIYNGSTTNIVWGTNTPNVGDSALLDAITKIADQAHQDALALANAMRTNNMGGSVNVTVTNNNHIDVTNSTDVTGLEMLLSGIKSNQVDVAGGNVISNRMISGMGNQTNWNGAQGAVEQIYNGVGLSGDIDNLKALFVTPEFPPGGSSDFGFTFCGVQINLDPAYRFPSAVLVCYWGILIVTYLWFAAKLGDMYMDAIKGFQTQQLGGVPNMEVENPLFGSNAIGEWVALIVPIVFVLGSALMLHVIFTSIFNALISSANVPTPSLSSMVSNFRSGLETGGGGRGLYLLTTFVPVNYILACICTKFVIQFTIGWIILLAAGTSRFLAGK